MEIWVLLIIAIRIKLEDAAERVEKRIMKVALNPTIEAERQSAIVSDLINKKNMIVNLKVMYDRIENVLSAEDIAFLIKFMRVRDDLDSFCIANKMTPTQLSEKVIQIADEGAKPLRRLGLTVGKMEDDYSMLPIVSMTLFSIKRIMSRLKASTPGIDLALKNVDLRLSAPLV